MTLYFILRWYRSNQDDSNEWVRFHFTDLLFVPAMCLFALIIIRLSKRDHTIVIPWYYVVGQTVLISLYFEWYLPHYPMFGNSYTSDMMDVYMYFMGALIFLLSQYFFLRAPEAENEKEA